MPWGRVAFVVLAVLGAPLVAHTQSPLNAFRAETLLTEWGTFRCSAVDCAQVPRAGLDVYWMAPTLVITRNHTPLVMRRCAPLPERATWDCRTGRASREAVGDLDALWSWVLPLPSDDEVDGF